MDDSAIVKWIAGVMSGLVVLMLGTAYKSRVDEKKQQELATKANLKEHSKLIYELINKQELFQHYIDEQREMKDEFKAISESIIKLTTLMGRNND
jgi:hypothetical protein